MTVLEFLGSLPFRYSSCKNVVTLSCATSIIQVIFESWLIVLNVRLKPCEFAGFSGAAFHRKGAAKTPCKCGSLAGFLSLRAQPGTVKYFSQKRLCKNEVLRREVRRGGCQAPLICPVAYSGGGVKGAASAAFIGVTGYGHADP